MADFVPSNIIQTPDFGQLAQGYLQQYRQEEAAKNKYLDSFSKKQGLYLEGDKPAVQEAWNKVQSVIDMVAENDTPETRRKLREAYGEYGQLAGAAQVIANQYRDEVATYKADPSKFSIAGQDFLNSSEEFRLQSRSANDIFSTIDNPFTLPRSIKYDLLNPTEQAKKMVSESRMKLPDFYNEEGELNKSALRAYAERRARAQVKALPENLEKAKVWGAINQDYITGVDSPQDLDFVNNSLDEDLQLEFIEDYVTELTNNYVDLVPSSLKKTADKDGKKLKALGGFTDVIIAAEQTKEGLDVPGTEISGKFLSLPTRLGNISAIGRGNDGSIYVRESIVEDVEKRDPRDPSKKIKTKETSKVTRRATAEEISTLISKYGNTYDLSLLSENFVPSQEEETQGFDLDDYFTEKGI